MDINRVAVVPHRAAQMFALVDDIAAYPQFLPWCVGAEVQRSGENVEAVLRIKYGGISSHFSTANMHRPPGEIIMNLKSGPLSALRGEWRFADIGDGRSRVELNLHYAFKSRILGGVFAGLFAMIFNEYLNHFIARAKTLYGADGGGASGKITVELAQTDASAPVQKLTLPAAATVADALAAGGFAGAEHFGIFGKQCAVDTVLQAGDRVEIYRPLQNDPRAARRERVAAAATAKAEARQ